MGDSEDTRPGAYVQSRVLSTVHELIDRFGRPVGVRAISAHLGVPQHIVARGVEALLNDGGLIAVQHGLYASPDALSAIGRVAYEHNFAAHIRVLRRRAERGDALTCEEVLAWCNQVERLLT